MAVDALVALLSRISLRNFPWFLVLLIIFFGLLSGCTTIPTFDLGDSQTLPATTDNNAAYNKPYKVKGKTYRPLQSGQGYKERGMASWYGAESGNRTASGVRFDPRGLTAAHKTLPIPSTVRVTNLRNGRSVDVVINDRGPFSHNRLIDLSKGAAEQLGMRGITEVTVEYVDG